MQFESWSAFWNMGGYAFYVWLSFGIALVVMLALLGQSAFEHKRLLKQISVEQRRKVRICRAQEAQANSPLTGPDRNV